MLTYIRGALSAKVHPLPRPCETFTDDLGATTDNGRRIDGLVSGVRKLSCHKKKKRAT